MTRDADMIPTKESGAQYGAGVGEQPQYQGLEIDLTAESDAALLQQRRLVDKLPREELEDRSLRYFYSSISSEMGKEGQRNRRRRKHNWKTYQVSPAAWGEHGVKEACVQAGRQDQKACYKTDTSCVGQEKNGGE